MRIGFCGFDAMKIRYSEKIEKLSELKIYIIFSELVKSCERRNRNAEKHFQPIGGVGSSVRGKIMASWSIPSLPEIIITH
jgi:hypothetical protein